MDDQSANGQGWQALEQEVKDALSIKVEEELPHGDGAAGKGSSGIQTGWLHGSRYSTFFLGTPGCSGMTEAAVLKGCSSGEEVSEGKPG